jgi:outer membrane protein, adhesin transport system
MQERSVWNGLGPRQGVWAGLSVSLLVVLVLTPAYARAGVLAQLVQAAIQGHPSVLAGRAQAQASQAEVEVAKWQFYPTVSIGAEAVSAPKSDLNYSGDSSVSTLRVQQPLWTGGKLSAGLQKAQAGLETSAASLAEARQQIALQVVQGYGEWLGAHLKSQAYDKSIKEHSRLRDQIRRRIDQGLASDVDEALASGRLDAVAAELSSVRVQKSTALTRLAQLLGRKVDDSELAAQPEGPLAIARRGDALQLERDAQLHSPAVIRAHAQVQVQRAIVGEREADLRPEVYLRVERQYGNYSNGSASTANRAFLGVSSRFGAGLSSFSSAQSAKALLLASESEVDVQKRVVSSQVLTDLALADQLESRIASLKASQVFAGQVFDSYVRQYLVGRKAWLEVMNANRELAQGEVQIADSTANLVMVTWRLAVYTKGLDVAVNLPSRP